MNTINRLFLTTVCVTLGLPLAAQAQQVGEQFRRDHNVGVLERKKPDYEALGLRDGGFLVVPRLSATLGYDDNILASPVATKSDTIATIIGEVHAMSDWNTNALQVNAKVTSNHYSSVSTENTSTWDLSTFGRLDIMRDAAVQGSFRDAYLAEDRTTPGAPFSDRPIRYQFEDLNLSGAKAFNRLRLTSSYRFRNLDYKANTLAGAPLSQDFRDHRQTDVFVRGEYAVSPDTAFLLEARYDGRNFIHSPVFDRDSHGYEVTAGVNFDSLALARGVVQVGYLRHNFSAAAATSDISGFTGHAEVDYFPTQLVTVTVRANRDILDSGVLLSPAVAANSAGAEADYELLRNLILTARIDYESDDFLGIARTDKRTTLSLGGKYLINHHLGLALQFSRIDLNSTGLAARPDFKDDRLSLSLVAQY